MSNSDRDAVRKMLKEFNSRIDYHYAAVQVNKRDHGKRIPVKAFSVLLGTNVYIGFDAPMAFYGPPPMGKNIRIAFYEQKDDDVSTFWIQLRS